MSRNINMKILLAKIFLLFSHYVYFLHTLIFHGLSSPSLASLCALLLATQQNNFACGTSQSYIWTYPPVQSNTHANRHFYNCMPFMWHFCNCIVQRVLSHCSSIGHIIKTCVVSDIKTHVYAFSVPVCVCARACNDIDTRTEPVGDLSQMLLFLS